MLDYYRHFLYDGLILTLYRSEKLNMKTLYKANGDTFFSIKSAKSSFTKFKNKNNLIIKSLEFKDADTGGVYCEYVVATALEIQLSADTEDQTVQQADVKLTPKPRKRRASKPSDMPLSDDPSKSGSIVIDDEPMLRDDLLRMKDPSSLYGVIRHLVNGYNCQPNYFNQTRNKGTEYQYRMQAGYNAYKEDILGLNKVTVTKRNAAQVINEYRYILMQIQRVVDLSVVDLMDM